MRPKESANFKAYDTNGMKRLRLHFSHLNEHKFQHNFRANIDPINSCSFEPETTLHYLYSDSGLELFNDICALNTTLKYLSHEKLLNSLLSRSKNVSFNTNMDIIKPVIKFLKTSECFTGYLF